MSVGTGQDINPDNILGHLTLLYRNKAKVTKKKIEAGYKNVHILRKMLSEKRMATGLLQAHPSVTSFRKNFGGGPCHALPSSLILVPADTHL